VAAPRLLLRLLRLLRLLPLLLRAAWPACRRRRHAEALALGKRLSG
jgi:hypothetical protein